MTKPSVQGERPGRETRRRLMGAAVELIAEQGWAGVTTRAVAERAGVNHSLVHYHFGSVDGLLFQAATAALAEAGDEALALLEDDDLASGLKASLEALAETVEQGPLAVATVEFLVQACRHDEMRAWLGDVLTQYREVMAERFRRAKADEALADLDPEALAVLVAALFDGLTLHLIVDPDLDLQQAIDTLVQAITTRKEPR
ncbi:MAG: TetR/AcrR family transcriptional regulator [Acidimicrobiia bacterium]